MKIKQVIIIIVIVVALAVAGIFFYKSISPSGTTKVKNTKTSAVVTPVPTPTATAVPAATAAVDSSGNPIAAVPVTTDDGSILPHGDTLDFTKVKKFNSSGQLFQYPTVTPDQIGAKLNDLISQ